MTFSLTELPMRNTQSLKKEKSKCNKDNSLVQYLLSMCLQSDLRKCLTSKWSILYQGKQKVPFSPNFFFFSSFLMDQNKKCQGFEFQVDPKQLFVCLFVWKYRWSKKKNQLFTLLRLGYAYLKYWETICLTNFCQGMQSSATEREWWWGWGKEKPQLFSMRPPNGHHPLLWCCSSLGFRFRCKKVRFSPTVASFMYLDNLDPLSGSG